MGSGGSSPKLRAAKPEESYGSLAVAGYKEKRKRRQERHAAIQRARDQETQALELMVKYDVSKTGSLSREEVKRLAQEWLTEFTPFVGGVSDEDVDMIMRCGGENVKKEVTMSELPKALAVMASIKEHNKSLVELFNKFDVDQTGSLPADQLKSLLKEVSGGVEVDESDVNYILMQCEPRNAKDPIGMNQLKAALACWYCLQKETSSDRMKLIFDAADVKGNGVIERDELKKLFSKLDKSWSDEQLEALVSAAFERFDSNKSGVLEYDQFIDWLNQD